MINKTTTLKKIEKKIYASTLNFLTIIKTIFLVIIKSIYRILTQKITIMMIPHSEKKVFNFRINLFLLIFSTIIVISSLGTIFYLTMENYQKSKEVRRASNIAQANEKKSREYEDMVSNIFDSHKVLKSKLNILLSNLDSTSIRALMESEHYNQNNQGGGQFNPIEKELTELDYDKMETQKILQDYRYSVQAFNEINKSVLHYNKLLKDLPFGSPVRGFYSITSTFGLRIHPIHRVLDHHSGIDLANERGTLVQATAPGIVEKVRYAPLSYGWYVIVRHRLGFSSLYAHLNEQPLVKPGQKINKNQIIGYMGTTGISTGVHLHYEVRISNKPVDPWDYISVY